MKPLTEDELRMNEQAADVAASTLGEPVEAATRFEQVTQDQQLENFGVGKFNRGAVKFSRGLGKAMMPRTMGGIKSMETGGLPKSFVLAVTASKVVALEDKQQGGQLVAGKTLDTWDRETFYAKSSDNASMAAVSGVPDDRQLVVIYLQLDGGKSKYMQAAARIQQQAGSPGQPHRVMAARDAASDRVVELITANAPAAGANIMIGGQSVADMMAQAQGGAAAAAPDPTEQLTKLADLHERGVLTDEEFAAQKSKILGA
jgi:Short C-terminal domain